MYVGVTAREYSRTCLESHPIGYKTLVSQDRWSLVTGPITLKCDLRGICGLSQSQKAGLTAML